MLRVTVVQNKIASCIHLGAKSFDISPCNFLIIPKDVFFPGLLSIFSYALYILDIRNSKMSQQREVLCIIASDSALAEYCLL